MKTLLKIGILFVFSGLAFCQTKPKPKSPPCKEGSIEHGNGVVVGGSGTGFVISDGTSRWNEGDQPKICKDGKWVEDVAYEDKLKRERAEAQAKWEAKEKRRQELWWALRTRVLTDAEEKEASDMQDSIVEYTGSSGYVSNGTVFYSGDSRSNTDIYKEVNDAWYQQRRLQWLAKHGCSKDGN